MRPALRNALVATARLPGAGVGLENIEEPDSSQAVISEDDEAKGG
jgi:hypothetical protein